jgi:hypothetical protein
MIISHKYKYIFIGLPLSGSSAISKELIESYDGQLILKKHSNIPYLLIKNKKIKIKDYFIFGVFRDPTEIDYSHYFKLKNNTKGVYTDPKYLKVNGGNISKKRLRLFDQVTSNHWTFSDYIKRRFISVPYDSDFSVNKKYFNYVIAFNNLPEGFENALLKCGITPIRQLPLYNKTKKKQKTLFIPTNEEIMKYYSPFIYENSIYVYKNYNVNVNRLSYFLFLFLKPVRFILSLVRNYKEKNNQDEYFQDSPH